MKIRNWKLKILRSREGQSLGEVLIGLTIGAILIGAASFLVVNTLRSNASLEKSQKATQVAQEMLDKVRSWGSADWFNIYDLSKGSTNKYFLNASGTTLSVVSGEEGVLSNDVTNGLVGYWRMDESTSTVAYDSSENSKNGTLTNSPVRSTSTCKISGCLDFSSSTSYVINNSGGFLPTGSSTRTIAFWFKPNFGMTTSNIAFGYGCTIEGLSCGSAGVGRYVGAWANTAQIGLHLETCQVTGPATPAPTTSWHFYTAVFNGGNTITFYMDGATPTTVTAPCTVNSSTGNGFSLGVGRWGYYNGSLDDVRVYNRVLSADEIKQLYQSSVYTRNFYIENTCRSTGATGEITGSGDSCAGGSANDPSTQKITVSVNWPSGATTTQLILSDYLTRWKNAIFEQADWSGGVDNSGSYTNSSDSYSSATNTDLNSSGVILNLP
jgi:type II secretory pathway pseudopilin PulG